MAVIVVVCLCIDEYYIILPKERREKSRCWAEQKLLVYICQTFVLNTLLQAWQTLVRSGTQLIFFVIHTTLLFNRIF